MRAEVLTSIEFKAVVIEWRGPAPFLFAPIPDEHHAEIRYAAHLASYGWGVVPVSATIGNTDFTTSLFPRENAFLLPIKIVVQRAEGIGLGDEVQAKIVITSQC